MRVIKELLEQISKLKFPLLLFIGGLFLTSLALFPIDDIKTLSVSVRNNLSYPAVIALIIGGVLMALAIILYLLPNLPFGQFFSSNIKKVSDGYSITKGQTQIKIKFGRIEEAISSKTKDLIALPANEFFDDECINDKRSALGAFIQSHFQDQVDEIQDLVKKDLENFSAQKVEKERANFVQSYGTGTCIYLNRPLNSIYHLAMVSVTTKRAGVGLYAEASDLIECILAIHRTMVDHRLNHLYLPLLGAGHGGVKPELSLLCMLISLVEIAERPTGHHLESVNIIVYKKDEGATPIISKRKVKQILSFAQEYC